MPGRDKNSCKNIRYFKQILLRVALCLVSLFTSNPSHAACTLSGTAVCNGVSCANEARPDGHLLYNFDNKVMQVCSGTEWKAVIGGDATATCADATPDLFNFTDLVNQSTSTLVSSDILKITGITCTVGGEVSGEGAPQFRICSDSACSTVIWDWTSSSRPISVNEYVQLRLTTSAAGGDTHSATLSVGTGADVWNATPTGDCSGSPAAGTVCADGTVYAGLSPDGNIKMYVTRCDAGMNWDGSTCTGTRLSLSWNDGNSNWVSTGYRSDITGESNTTNIAPLDSNNVLAGTQDHVAVVYCNDLSQDGYTDWYLPALEELNVIYGNKDVIGHFDTSGNYYWSSSEHASTYDRADMIRFSDGYISPWSYKDNNYKVRCARR